MLAARKKKGKRDVYVSTSPFFQYRRGTLIGVSLSLARLVIRVRVSLTANVLILPRKFYVRSLSGEPAPGLLLLYLLLSLARAFAVAF